MKLLRIKVESENKINPRFANAILAKIFSSEAILLDMVNLPFEVSIICVVERINSDHTIPIRFGE